MTKILAPADPNVKLPPAVTAAAKRSEDLITASKQVTSESNPPPPPPADPAPAPEAPPTPAPPAPQPTPAAQPIDWEARYRAMHGRFEQSSNQVRGLTQQLEQMQSLIANLRTAPPPASPADVRFVTPKEQEEYGTEFLDVVGKRTKEVVAPEIDALRSEVKQLQAQLGSIQSTTVRTVREKMFDDLTKNIPNWRQINEDQKFLEWLSLPDPYSGDIRHSLLREAFNNNQTGRVEAFFQGYLAQEAATRPADAASTRQSGAQPPKIDLAALAAPGRAKQAGAPPAPDEKPIFTSAQIRQFYKEVSTGLWNGRDSERVAMEQAIFAAGSEGRIRG